MYALPFEGPVSELDIRRFQEKTKEYPETGCLIWIAANKSVYNDTLYGVFSWVDGNGKRRTVSAHRFALYIAFGIDPGTSVDHLCKVTLCVNVDHLRGGSILENNRTRGPVLSEYCKNGHLRSPENTHWVPGTDHRRCRECARERDRKRTREHYNQSRADLTHDSTMKDFNSNPKLSLAIAEQIRQDFNLGNVSKRSLAKKYFCSPQMVGLIIANKTWKRPE